MERLLFLPLIVFALLLTLGLILALAHILPHLAGLIIVGLILVVCVVPLLHSSREADKIAVEPDPRKIAERREGELHAANATAEDPAKQQDTLASRSPDTSQTSTPDDPNVRPDWVDKLPHLEQRQGMEVYVATAMVGPYSTAEECDRELAGAIGREVDQYVENRFGRSEGVRLDPQFVQERLIERRWRENVNVSIGAMQQEHVLLVFDQKVQAELEHLWRQVVVAQRLTYAAAGTSALLLLVGSVYSVLKWWPAGKPRVAA